jgi:hypothetical protein
MLRDGQTKRDDDAEWRTIASVRIENAKIATPSKPEMLLPSDTDEGTGAKIHPAIVTFQQYFP